MVVWLGRNARLHALRLRKHAHPHSSGERGTRNIDLTAEHTAMNNSSNQFGRGFGWAVLIYGSGWLFATAAALVYWEMVNLVVLKLFLVVTLIWACTSIGLIVTGWPPRGR